MLHFDKVIVPFTIYEYCFFNRKRERKLKLSNKIMLLLTDFLEEDMTYWKRE